MSGLPGVYIIFCQHLSPNPVDFLVETVSLAAPFIRMPGATQTTSGHSGDQLQPSKCVGPARNESIGGLPLKRGLE